MPGTGNVPKHRTGPDFRALHLKELGDLFVQMVKLAREMGLIKLGTVAHAAWRRVRSDGAPSHGVSTDVQPRIHNRQGEITM